jgi:hypothetical protein
MLSKRFSRLDYCQFLYTSQTNYTLTYLADHLQKCSHDTINRFLRDHDYKPSFLWEHVSSEIIPSENGILIFDDTVLDKINTKKIELARRQYSGNTEGVTIGIGLVTCVYYNPELEQVWVIDYRIFSPKHDGKTKVEHVLDMLRLAALDKKLKLKKVLMDTWYATRDIMMEIDKLEKIFYCPVKANRKASRAIGNRHIPIYKFTFSDEELKHGMIVHFKDFPVRFCVKLFCNVIATDKVEYIVTNDLSQNDSEVAQDECKIRWIIELFHREIKQTTGIGKCECRKQKIQRNHIACSMLVWSFMKRKARELGTSIYQLKEKLLNDYMMYQLRSPAIRYLEIR